MMPVWSQETLFSVQPILSAHGQFGHFPQDVSIMGVIVCTMFNLKFKIFQLGFKSYKDRCAQARRAHEMFWRQ